MFDCASNVLIEGCTFHRNGVDEEIEATAIHAKASVPEIRGNTIAWQNVYGVWLQFGKAYCKDLPWGVTDTLKVVENQMTGQGTDDVPGSAAVRGEYLCQNHATLIDHNIVTAWEGRAIDLYETSDVHVTCNTLDGNYAGAQYFGRDWLQTFEEDVFWLGNSLRQNASDNLKVLYETRLRFYDAAGSGEAAGQNSLRPASGGGARNVRIAGGSLDVEVDARSQTWFNAAGDLLTDPGDIQATNAPGPGTIVVDDPLASEQLCGEGAAAARGVEAPAPDQDREGGTPGDAGAAIRLPDQWSLDLHGSNPASGSVALTLGAPGPGPARVSIFDVRGRRVRILHEGPLSAGFHPLRWDRSLEGGGTAAAGVYFLRAESPGFRATRKIVLLPSAR